MRLEVYRDSREGMELVGAFASTDFGIRFFYDVRYVQRGEEKGEFGTVSYTHLTLPTNSRV